MMQPDGGSKETLSLRLSATDCLQQRLDQLLATATFEGVSLSEEDFHLYGRDDNGQFVPYWREGETFEQFAQREVGLDRSSDEVVIEALNTLLFDKRIPISQGDIDRLKSMGNILSPDEVEGLQAHAILVEDEAWHGLAVQLQSLGDIAPGTVDAIKSPLLRLYESADPEIREFFDKVRSAADAVYGVPDYYPNLVMDSEVVERIRSQEVIYTEPQMKLIEAQEGAFWSVTIRGEAQEARTNSPVFSLEKTVNLLVKDRTKNQGLTAFLLGNPDLLRYWAGAKIIDLQRKKMEDLSHVFMLMRHRKSADLEGAKWVGKRPVKRPED